MWSRPAERGGAPFAVLRSHLRLLSANDMPLWSATEELTRLAQHGRGAASNRRHRRRNVAIRLLFTSTPSSKCEIRVSFTPPPSVSDPYESSA